MELLLENKKILVTGSSRGLGRSIVESYLKEGAYVVMSSRSQENMETAVFSFGSLRERLSCVKVDAENEESVLNCVQQSIEQMGGMDILVNNVGGAGRFAGFFELEHTDWLNHFNLNVMSMVNFSKHAHPYLKESSTPRIVNISSITGFQPGFYNPHYSICKAATINLSKHLANIFIKDKIVVNCIAPGPFESHSWKRYIETIARKENISFEDAAKKEYKMAELTIPMGRLGKPEDIVPFVLMLSSPTCNWAAGSCFVIDGGKMKSI